MITQEQVIDAVNEILEGTDKFLVEVLIYSGNRITVFFDSDGLVSIGDCQKLNRAIESRFDRETEDYELTVSSSGMDRPLKLMRQYKKRIGKGLEVVTNAGEKISGVLVNTGETTIELEHPVKNAKKDVAKPNTILELENIKTAKLIITIGK